MERPPKIETTMKTTPYILTASLTVLLAAAAHAQITSEPPPIPWDPNYNVPLDPYTRDDDGDGLANMWDEYPFDAAQYRKENIGIRHYGLLDLTRYPYGDMIGQFTGSTIPFQERAIAVDDEHRVAWWTREPIPLPSGGFDSRHHWWSWDNNNISDRRYLDNARPNAETVQSYAPSDISPFGMLVGTWSEQVYSDSKTRGFYSGRYGHSLVYPQGGNLDWLDSRVDMISWSGSSFVLYGNGNTGPEAGPITPNRMFKTQWQGSGSFDFKAVNRLGSALGIHIPWAPMANPPPLPVPAVYTSAGIFTIGNAQHLFDFANNYAIGEQQPDLNGAVWDLNTGQSKDFQLEWLPEIVRNQFFQPKPCLINEANEIIFTAMHLQGDSGHWKSGVFWTHEGAIVQNRSFDAKICLFGDWPSTQPVAVLRQNQVGTLAVNWNGKPALAIPVEFITEDHILGFDYPLYDDPPFLVNSEFDIDQMDQSHPRWWTLVTNTDYDSDGSNVSSHVTLRFENDDAARMFKVRVSPQTPGLITIDQGGGAIGGKETPLVIRAQGAALTTIATSLIEVVPVNAPDSGPTQVLRSLFVMVAPERILPVRICFVYDDSKGPDGPDNPTSIRSQARIADEIVARLNRTFHQCGVKLFKTSNSGPVAVRFDKDVNGNGGDNRLASANLNQAEAGEFTKAEYGFDRNTLTIFVVKGFSYPNGAAGYISVFNNQATRWAFVSESRHPLFDVNNPALPFHVDSYLHTCSHEIGHGLGIASHAFANDPTASPVDQANWMHDFGKRPHRYGQGFPLMHPVGGIRYQDYWIRSEDWIRVQARAQLLLP
jgi:hypothetical protein